MTDGPLLTLEQTADMLQAVYGYLPWWWLRTVDPQVWARWQLVSDDE